MTVGKGQRKVIERRAWGNRDREKAIENWEQMKTRAQGAKTDDKYALTSNRDSARNEGRLTGKRVAEGLVRRGVKCMQSEACAKTCKSPSKQF